MPVYPLAGTLNYTSHGTALLKLIQKYAFTQSSVDQFDLIIMSKFDPVLYVDAVYFLR